MEKKLSALFDFQKYEKSAKLQTVIDRVHTRYSSVELSDDDVVLVAAAAGIPKTAPEKRDPADKINGLS